VQSAETRQRIIDAARDLIAESGVLDTSLGAVAWRAKSTRTTVYHQFGSRGQLLAAVMNDALARDDVRGLRRAAAEQDAAMAVRMMLGALCRFWASDYAFFARIKGLANVDPAIAEVNNAQVETRRGDLVQLAHRLAA
jgi:AcrR family transcriptional regulator